MDGVTRTLLRHLGLAPPAGWRAAPATRRQTDDLNADWIDRYRPARGGCRRSFRP
jgi:LPS sulfotransferase NodH